MTRTRPRLGFYRCMGAVDRGASRKELETLHLLKALLGAVIVDAEAAA